MVRLVGLVGGREERGEGRTGWRGERGGTNWTCLHTPLSK